MPIASRFERELQAPLIQGQGAKEQVMIDFRGLDLTSPYDMVQKNRSPNARNFRLYAEESDDRRVAVSNRRGKGRYIDTIGSTAGSSHTTTTTVGDAVLGIELWRSMPFTSHSSTSVLDYVELRLKKSSGATGPILVDVYTDNSGDPGVLIASSSISNDALTTSYAYVPAHFIEGPTLTASTVYHIVARLQDDAVGTFHWSYLTTGTTPAPKTSVNSGLTWDTFSDAHFNYKTYYTTTGLIKNAIRYAPSSASNTTVFALADKLYKTNDSLHTVTQIVSGLTDNSDVCFTQADGKVFWVNGTDNLKSWDGTTVETITHTQLPVLKLAAFHKNVLWGVTVADPNKIIYSIAPAEVDSLGNQWYKGYLSTNFGYFPEPKSNDPITSIRPFQDTLVVFTASKKGLIYGSNNADVQPREATGKKGAVSHKGTFADENFVYFVATDGIYRFNGSEDKIISDLIQPRFDEIADLSKVTITKWKRQVRFYYPSPGSAYNDKCLIWHTVLEEWLEDTETYTTMGVPFTDGDDDYEMAEVSSTKPAIYFAEVNDHDYGHPLDFVYDCKCDSFGNPAKRKRINKLYPLLEGSGGDYDVQVGLDKDRQGTPRYSNLSLASDGAKIGQFVFGDGTRIGVADSYKPARIRASGYAYYWQLRIARKAVDNTVRFVGYVLSYRTKRL